VCLIAFGTLAYELIWGKLFPFSPVILGFTCKELPHVVVCLEDGNRYGPFEWTDDLVAGVEQFHGLTLKSKPKLFAFTKEETYARRSLSKARVCAFYNGSIVISPRIQREDANGVLSLKVYLIHELSHSLLYQNMSLGRKFGYPRWLIEGVATYSANQMGTYLYPSERETYTLIRNGNWMPPESFETDKEDAIPLKVDNRKPFMYTEFACIVSDLNERYGRSAFLKYLTQLLRDYDHDAAFLANFGVEFGKYLVEFRRRVLTATAQPEKF
jgi:hypothetical protein